jgi:hypothetical protein
MQFLKHLRIIFKLLILDNYEKKFLLNNKVLKKNKSKKYILIQLVEDYYYVYYYKKLINKYFLNYKIICLWPQMYLPVRKSSSLIEFLKDNYNKILLKLKFYKWKKIYSALGVEKFEQFSDKCSYKPQYKFKSNKKLLNYKVQNIKFGDIIYDTYIRYRASPKVLLNDKYLNLYVNFALKCLEQIKDLQKKYSFKYFFTSYATYVHHGVPVRYFLNKTNVEVFSGRNSIQYNQKLSKNHMYHTYNYKSFKLKKKISKEIPYKKIETYLNRKYNGLQKTKNFSRYMVVDPYKKNNLKTDQLNNIDGVLFTQSIYDSPHAWGGMLYNDYYEWICDSLEYIKKNNLKIAIKPHPNSIKKQIDVKNLHLDLKKKYPELIWLNENLSNKEIFKKIKFGVSATGSVLFELSWHNILPVSCGQSPYSYFKFSLNANTKKKYYYFLKNAQKIKNFEISKKKLLEFYYFYNFYDHNFFKIDKLSNFIQKNKNFNSKVLIKN